MITELPGTIAPAEGDPPPGLAADHPMRAVTRAVAFDPDGWTKERRLQVAALFDELADDWHTRDLPGREAPLLDALDRGLDAAPLADRRVALELTRLGVDRAMIDQVLAELAEDRPEHAGPAAVADAAGRRARALARLEPAVAERRLVSWLVRRGFGIGESARAARGALGRR